MNHEMASPHHGRLEFANTLRGLAALIVLLGHYVLVFHNIKGSSTPWFVPREEPLYFNAYAPWAIETMRYLNPGPFAVSLFFLISGLVIPQSVAALASKTNGRAAFAVGRLFRIWPTYCICLTVSLVVLSVMPHLNDYRLPFTRLDVVANMSLFRGLIGGPQFDGIVWTLEIEVLFYLYILLVWRCIAAGRLTPLALIAIITVAASRYGANIEMSLAWNGAANLLYPLPYLTFMSIGIAFNYHGRTMLKSSSLLATAAGMFAIFGWVAMVHQWDSSTVWSYGIALLVFTLFYFFARGWSGGSVLDFFAKISFPLYAVHPVLGYTGMAFLLSIGFSDWNALFIMTTIAILAAWLIHVAVEAPSHRLGKSLGVKITAGPPLMPSVGDLSNYPSTRTSS
ncbi:acyltransferase family protein [Achromobacter xylosoxidans]|uniref:acyltransferase family protein n=1 Tax=Alcaligenes xylosoxydans xylosoxydans TaxID=85698 RepID=UPI000B48FFCA|nr:acyltransferase [Achromobacter xylosoxidans]